jgi:hypothetical protein
LQIEAAAVKLDKPFGQWQAKASSLIFPVKIAVNLAKLGESFGNVLWFDSNPSIGNLKYVATSHLTPSLDHDLSARMCKLDRIG